MPECGERAGGQIGDLPEDRWMQTFALWSEMLKGKCIWDQGLKHTTIREIVNLELVINATGLKKSKTKHVLAVKD